ncbi:MAG: hypothetical protein FWG35_07190 [Spirochaetaceae bacterium]|nr:hypothetical protein [Spirochaetaceae bacterium]
MSKLPTEGLTFEKVWAMFQETDLKFKETAEQMKITDRKMQEVSEQQRETDRQIKETDRQMKETDRQMKETDRRFGELGNRFGELAEHLVAPGIVEKFNALGFHFTRDTENNTFRDPETGKTLAEVDIVLENGDIVIAVEVKSKPQSRDVDDHLRRMDVLRRLADLRRDSRKYRGAMAGAILTDETRDYAQKAGLYVLQQSGDTMKLNIPEGFVPREW